jgi:hypothetical protein
MMEVVEERIRRELTAIEEQQHGALIIRVGKVLLWTVLVPACFLYASLRVGSYVYLWWLLGQAALGLLLIHMGRHKKNDAERRFVELTRGRR